MGEETPDVRLCCIFSRPYGQPPEPWVCTTCGVRNAYRCEPEPSNDSVPEREMWLAGELADIALGVPPVRYDWVNALEHRAVKIAADDLEWPGVWCSFDGFVSTTGGTLTEATYIEAWRWMGQP